MKKRTILYIAYDTGINKPLLHSQGIPHLKRLVARGYECILITFEDSESLNTINTCKDDMINQFGLEDVRWLCLKRGRIKIPHLSALIDVIISFSKIEHIVKENKVSLVHARSVVAGVISAFLKIFRNVSFVYDPRNQNCELHWKTFPPQWLRGFIFYLTDWFIMFNSSAVVATSTKFAKSIEKNYRFALGARFPKVFVVPNLVDTDKFFYKYADRVRIRNKYNLNDKTVIAYSGYFSVGRKFKEMINFFLSFKKKIESAHFLCITYEPYKVKEYLSDRLYENLFTVIEARPQEMPALLSAADVALMFLDIDVNYLASPIKFAEYIACGLPVVLNTGISDLDELVEREKIGIIICDFSDQAYSEGIDKLIDIMHDKPLLINRCSTVAKSELSLNNTIKTLEEIYEYVAKA